jgi:two-component system NtrC family sensor kinase
MSEKPSILIVEDSPTQAMRLRLVLEAEGWNGVAVGTAEHALDEIDRQPPEAIIVDYCLPGMSGDELCRRIRMRLTTRAIPVIMLTADENEEAEVRGLESGADDFFRKSADTDILVARIRRMLERQGAGSREQGETVQAACSVLPARRSRRARILAVDDSETYLCHLRCLLEGDGYSLDLLSDPKEALRRLESTAYDLALVDLVMPEMDGIAVCQKIVSLRRQLDNPIAVLMLTGREAKEDLTRALEAGADDFVGKSSDEAVLKGRIRALLRRKFYQEENQRILEELKNKELETIAARAEKEAAVARVAEERRRHAEAAAAELRQAKAELEKTNEELTRSNDELRQFAFVASHDLQEPLRSVTSFCNLLKEEYQGRLDDEADNYIERIVQGAKRMKSLVVALLSYSRVTRDEQPPLGEVDMQEVARETIANLQSAVEESKAEISLGDLPTVLGMRVQLSQLLQNLLSNAVLYRSETPPRIRIDAVPLDRRGGSANRWLFSVEDNGIGIAAEYHQQIFEIFRRLHSRDKYPGTGIGLAVCKKIVERHGGRIWVESQPGAGTVFKFTLPAVEPDRCMEHETSELRVSR